MMHGREKSDSVIVAVKSPNKTGEPGAEAMERRAGAEENASQRRTRRTQSRESVSQTRSAYGRPQGFAVTIRGGSRMRESRTSGSATAGTCQEQTLRIWSRGFSYIAR
jgi:hypothetical protein